MKLFTFGDSWTEGVGGDLDEEYTTEIAEDRTSIRHKYAWPTQLSKLLNVDLQNDGVGGFSNNAIFNAVNFKLKNELITTEQNKLLNKFSATHLEKSKKKYLIKFL